MKSAEKAMIKGLSVRRSTVRLNAVFSLGDPDTKSGQSLIFIKKRFNTFDFDRVVQALLEFLLDDAVQGLVVGLEDLVMGNHFSAETVDGVGAIFGFHHDTVADSQRQWFVVEDLPGSKKNKEQDGGHHQIVLPGSTGVFPKESVFEKEINFMEHGFGRM